MPAATAAAATASATPSPSPASTTRVSAATGRTVARTATAVLARAFAGTRRTMQCCCGRDHFACWDAGVSRSRKQVQSIEAGRPRVNRSGARSGLALADGVPQIFQFLARKRRSRSSPRRVRKPRRAKNPMEATKASTVRMSRSLTGLSRDIPTTIFIRPINAAPTVKGAAARAGLYLPAGGPI